MSILVTGATGTIGGQVIASLLNQGIGIRALTRSPVEARLPAGVTAVRGHLADIDSVRAALSGVSTLFLLAPNVADELTQAMQAVALAREAGIKGIVYLSVYPGGAYADVPHFASKYTVERMIEALDLPATILRPSYFIQNDLRQKDPLLGAGLFAMPIGGKGISMVDIRDIGEAAAIELLRRERTPAPLPRETYALVGPEAITGESAAAIWAEALGRPVRYAGDDLSQFEQRLKTMMPGWYALDLHLMMTRYQTTGAAAGAAEVARFADLLGHAPRSYRDFARDAASQWAKA